MKIVLRLFPETWRLAPKQATVVGKTHFQQDKTLSRTLKQKDCSWEEQERRGIVVGWLDRPVQYICLAAGMRTWAGRRQPAELYLTCEYHNKNTVHCSATFHCLYSCSCVWRAWYDGMFYKQWPSLPPVFRLIVSTPSRLHCISSLLILHCRFDKWKSNISDSAAHVEEYSTVLWCWKLLTKVSIIDISDNQDASLVSRLDWSH